MRYVLKSRHFRRRSYSFGLADGAAPFRVLGLVNVSIPFSNLVTTIDAHIAQQICADMIIGMDYINKYNLHVDVQNQLVSIDYNNTIALLPFDKDYDHIKAPVTSVNTVHIPPSSSHATIVSNSLSSICATFILHPSFRYTRTLITNTTKLDFQNYRSVIILSNMSSSPNILHKGTCLGYLICRFVPSRLAVSAFSSQESFGAASPSGVLPVDDPCLLHAVIPHTSSYSSKDTHHNNPSSNNSNVSNHSLTSTSKAVPIQHIDSLLSHIQDPQHKDALHSLLIKFHKTFDTTKHNIASTAIPHIINTVPHSPPASRPYPQPGKEEAMYKLVQEFLHAGLISESH